MKFICTVRLVTGNSCGNLGGLCYALIVLGGVLINN
jgi:hypothetical protein